MSTFQRPMVTRLGNFITAREQVRRNRAKRLPKPWTFDPILQHYRFCNVQREDDKVTQWIAKHIRRPYAAHPQLWFMLCIARIINEPEVLADLMAAGDAWPNHRWDARYFAGVLKRRAAAGQKITTGVYMITTHGSGKPKPDYLAENYLLPLWQKRSEVGQRLAAKGTTLEEAHAILSDYRGWGDFLVGQVLADLKHTRVLEKALDWHDWAVLGPGSERGLRRVMGVPLPAQRPAGGNVRRAKYAPSRADKGRNVELLAMLRGLLKPVLRRLKLELCLQDLQNCLCEFDKYERERLGEGHPRNKYDGLANQT